MNSETVGTTVENIPTLYVSTKVTEEKKKPTNEQVVERMFDMLDGIVEVGEQNVILRQATLVFEKDGKETKLEFYNWPFYHHS